MPDHLRRFSEGYKLLLAFTLLGSASIHAQTCTGVTQTPILRAESLDELVGDVVVTCSFGSIPPGTSLVFNILYSVNAQITSQPRPYWQANGTEIILILDDLATTPVY